MVLLGDVNRDEHDVSAVRRHVAERVQELQLSELIVSMGVLDRPSPLSRSHLMNHASTRTGALDPIRSSSCDEYQHDGEDEDVPYTRAMTSTVKKRPALRDVDFSLLDDSYEVV